MIIELRGSYYLIYCPKCNDHLPYHAGDRLEAFRVADAHKARIHGAYS